jgi:hypothetical protein
LFSDLTHWRKKKKKKKKKQRLIKHFVFAIDLGSHLPGEQHLLVLATISRAVEEDCNRSCKEEEDLPVTGSGVNSEP